MELIFLVFLTLVDLGFSGVLKVTTAQKIKKSLMENFIFCAVSGFFPAQKKFWNIAAIVTKLTQMLPVIKCATRPIWTFSVVIIFYRHPDEFRTLSNIFKGVFGRSHQMCSVKKVFLQISQNLQENTCFRVSFK